MAGEARPQQTTPGYGVCSRVRPEGFDITESAAGEIQELEDRQAGDARRRATAAGSGLRQAWVRPRCSWAAGSPTFHARSCRDRVIIYYAPTILTDKRFFRLHRASRPALALDVTYLVMMIVGLLDRRASCGRRRLTPGHGASGGAGSSRARLVLRHRALMPEHDNVPFVRGVPDRVHVGQRGRAAADGLAHPVRRSTRLGGARAGTSVPRGRCGAPSLPDHADVAHHDRTYCGVGPGVLDLRRLQRRRPGTRVSCGCREESPVTASRNIEKHIRDGNFRPKDFAAASRLVRTTRLDGRA